jgi:endonuclease/exonuclease/phosphatase (EEP) superfamily protein YafD
MQEVLIIISLLLLSTVVLSLIRDDYWVFRALEYPRLQKLILILLCIGCWFIYLPFETTLEKSIVAALSVSAVYLIYKIWPYSLMAKKEMMRVPAEQVEDRLKIFAANVLQTNTQYSRLLEQIEATNPDIILLLETNQAWVDAMNTLKKKYAYNLIAPFENTYGITFYSRLPLENPKIKYLVKNDLPSVDTIVILPSGKKVQLYGVHPEPPAPDESLTTTAKDKELMKIALKAKACKLPCIVFGDLNDVAWSHTTELFRKTSNMLDPRRGRGFFNTFSAHHWFIRFPLDYVFCSKQFGLIDMRRMPKNGSDHYAMFIQLALTSHLEDIQHTPHASISEKKEASKIAVQPVQEISTQASR